jgi:hypothetical protein
MKKLYFIDNYEKNRILTLHESATKKQYLQKNYLLSEQTMSSTQPLISKIKKVNTQKKNQDHILGLAKRHFIDLGYPCIGNSNNPDLKGYDRKDGTFNIFDTNYTYYSNGRRMINSTKQMEYYHCEGNNVVQGPAEQLGQFNPSYDSETSTDTSKTSAQSASPDTSTQQYTTNTQPRVASGMGIVL